MPVETHYVDSGKGAHKFARGILTSAEVIETGRKQAADVEANRKLKYLIYDCTDVTEVRVTSAAIHELIEVNRITAEYSQGAYSVIVAPDPLGYGLARMWVSYSVDLGWKAAVYHTREEAIQWLRGQLGKGDADSPALAEYPSLKI